MAILAVDKNDSSAPRVKKHRENMLKNGFKCIQKWVFDIENTSIQEKMRNDLAYYKISHEEKEWGNFAFEQLKNLEECK